MTPTTNYLTKRITYLSQEQSRLQAELTQITEEIASHQAVIKMIEDADTATTTEAT